MLALALTATALTLGAGLPPGQAQAPTEVHGAQIDAVDRTITVEGRFDPSRMAVRLGGQQLDCPDATAERFGCLLPGGEDALASGTWRLEIIRMAPDGTPQPAPGRPQTSAQLDVSLGDPGVTNVLDVGAVADGISDDTAAIQAAVDATPTGGVVFFPPGRYRVSDEIVINRPVNVIGSGRGTQIFQSDPVASLLVFGGAHATASATSTSARPRSPKRRA